MVAAIGGIRDLDRRIVWLHVITPGPDCLRIRLRLEISARPGQVRDIDLAIARQFPRYKRLYPLSDRSRCLKNLIWKIAL